MHAFRMYSIGTKALVFMPNGGSSYGFTIHPIHQDLHAISSLLGLVYFRESALII